MLAIVSVRCDNGANTEIAKLFCVLVIDYNGDNLNEELTGARSFG